MQQPPQGAWSGHDQMKPAAEYDIRYGHNLVTDTSSNWRDYIAVTSPTAFSKVKPILAQLPKATSFPEAMDFEYLEGLTQDLPNASMVVGIGGGLALDAAKYVALRKQLPLVLVPTIVSTGAIIHSVFAKWEGRNLGDAAEWPWIDPEYVLVDYDVVLSAPSNLNIAGIGDVLCTYSTVCEWKRHTRLGNGEPYDPNQAVSMFDHHKEIIEKFPKTLDQKGQLTVESVDVIMKAVQDRDERNLRHPNAPAGDHSFIVAVELANDRSWVHGELAALGAVIIAWQTGEKTSEFIADLDRCKVRWRPLAMGMKADELHRGLRECISYMGDISRGRDMHSVLREEPVIDNRFEELWAWLETL